MTPNIIAIGIHNGAVIHHQDQSIKLVNFNVIKIRNNIVPNPRPLLELLLFDMTFSFNMLC